MCLAQGPQRSDASGAHSISMNKHLGYDFVNRFMLHSLILSVFVSFKIEPWCGISNNVICATSEASDQPAHKRRLIRAFASRLSVL